ncbi:hypothetical protein FZEAL_6910 [Fusarium zealandicum]|uniref:Uncharacterized protein n=1 Tax=Fusarium zealandicum TaxID=1053134 RepID=A0A8H4UGW2_9HYPO|nr:hypothetical protein FZEAL_6910 [Fusarium zealandicum]
MVAITLLSAFALITAATMVNAAPASNGAKFDKVVTADGSDEPENTYNRDPYGLQYTGEGFTKEEYAKRNLQWLRCEPRAHEHEYRFTVGGSWAADGAAEIEAFLEKRKCGVWGFEHKFDNGKGWGDGTLDLAFYKPDCDMEDIIDAAVIVGYKSEKNRNQRWTNIQLYNCPGYGNDWRVKSEEEAFVEHETRKAKAYASLNRYIAAQAANKIEADSKKAEADSKKTEADSKETKTESKKAKTDKPKTESKKTETESKKSKSDSKKTKTDETKAESKKSKSDSKTGGRRLRYRQFQA